MATDSALLRIAQKELRLFFASPVAWLFLAVFAAVSLFTFFWVDAFFARNIADLRPLFEWMPVLLIFLCAALTMRSWSEERRSGTLEYVLTQPTPLWQFVLGKFLACWALLALALLSTLPLPVTVELLGEPDWGPIIAGYVAAALLGGVYLAGGLWVSARTDNAIVSLLGATALGVLLYGIGSPLFTGYFADRNAGLLRALGSGAHFESITRGVLDARDVAYYLTLTAALLVLNVYALERSRWAPDRVSPARRRWRTGVALALANLLLVNVWLAQLPGLRLDLTAGRLYSISEATRQSLAGLDEPLLLRGYFSARSHPLLAPLAPELRDLLREYAVAGGDQVRVEIVDPATDPAAEQEAIEHYGMRATPVQLADRHQSSLVNAWFNVLVRYGSVYQTLGFSDLIEARTAANAVPEVRLRNPEYALTRAIRKVQADYRLGGRLFDGIAQPVEFIAYVSSDERLPGSARTYRAAIVPLLEQAAAASDGKFSLRFIDPDARDGKVAQTLTTQWGVQPLSDEFGNPYYFHMTLADAEQVVPLSVGGFDASAFRLTLDAGLKRFTRGFTRTVALVAPAGDAAVDAQAPTFGVLEQAVGRGFRVLLEDLGDGSVDPEADILAVLAPEQLDSWSVLAIDQFLMRGGTVLLATSPFSARTQHGELQLAERDSGLTPWLAQHGVTIAPTLVLDEQHTVFPAPVLSKRGEVEVSETRLVDYPYFLDLRAPGLAPEHPVTAGLPQLTMAWASPLAVAPPAAGQTARHADILLRSSPRAWLRAGLDIAPDPDIGAAHFAPEPPIDGSSVYAAQTLGIALSGPFDSLFATTALPDRPPSSVADELHDGEGSDGAAAAGNLVLRSPASSRLIVFGSNDFLSDRVLGSVAAASGGQYHGALELFENTLEWALRDDALLGIRSRGHFNRTLPPLSPGLQARTEYLNYALALAWLGVLALLSALLARRRRRTLARSLGL